MIRRSLFVIGYLSLILLIGSCGKSTCLDPGICVKFSGFDSTDLLRVVIQQYEANSNFSKLVSISVLDTAYIQVQQSNDTIYMPNIDTAGTYIAPGYDYIIAVPSVQQSFFGDSVFEITKISYTQVKRKVSGTSGACTNDASYYLDTIPYKVSGQSFNDINPPPVTIVLNY